MGIVSLPERDAIVWHDTGRARRGTGKHALETGLVAKSGNERSPQARSAGSGPYGQACPWRGTSPGAQHLSREGSRRLTAVLVDAASAPARARWMGCQIGWAVTAQHRSQAHADRQGEPSRCALARGQVEQLQRRSGAQSHERAPDVHSAWLCRCERGRGGAGQWAGPRRPRSG